MPEIQSRPIYHVTTTMKVVSSVVLRESLINGASMKLRFWIALALVAACLPLASAKTQNGPVFAFIKGSLYSEQPILADSKPLSDSSESPLQKLIEQNEHPTISNGDVESQKNLPLSAVKVRILKEPTLVQSRVISTCQNFTETNKEQIRLVKELQIQIQSLSDELNQLQKDLPIAEQDVERWSNQKLTLYKESLEVEEAYKQAQDEQVSNDNYYNNRIYYSQTGSFLGAIQSGISGGLKRAVRAEKASELVHLKSSLQLAEVSYNKAHDELRELKDRQHDLKNKLQTASDKYHSAKAVLEELERQTVIIGVEKLLQDYTVATYTTDYEGSFSSKALPIKTYGLLINLSEGDNRLLIHSTRVGMNKLNMQSSALPSFPLTCLILNNSLSDFIPLRTRN